MPWVPSCTRWRTMTKVWCVDWLIELDWTVLQSSAIDWLMDWSIDGLIDWSIDWWIDRSMDWLIDWLIGFPANEFIFNGIMFDRMMIVARMLIRICRNIGRFPKDASRFLLSAVLECIKCQLNKSAMQWVLGLPFQIRYFYTVLSRYVESL